MSFKDRLAAQKTAEKATTEPVPVIVDGELFELVFEVAEPGDWANITAKHPPRADVNIDLRYGYNYNAVVPDVAKLTGRVVDGDEKLELSADEWDDLFSVITGSELNSVANAIWALNEWDPEQRIKRLKKARRRESGSSQS